MKSFFCTRQKEITAALESGRWAQATELQTHAASCRTCSDLVLVAQTLQQARHETMHGLSLEPGMAASRLASSGALWWRSELRRRRQAVERVTRPIAFAEKLALMGVPLALLGLIAWQWNKISDWLAWLMAPSNSSLLSPGDGGATVPAATGVISMLLIVSLVGFILISGLAWFLLAEKE